MCVVLRVHGICVGWIRVHHELAAAACVRADMHGTFQSEAVRELHDVVRAGHVGEHAGAICRLLADPKQ